MKNSKIAAAILFFFFLFLIVGCGEKYSGPSADIVIKNANVLTIDKDNRRAEAVAVKGDKIISVTSNRAIEQYIEAGKTEIIDAGGRLVIPGFNDAHAHFGSVDPDYVELRYITDPKIITEKVREKVAIVRSGELISGGHWEHEMFYNKQWPTKDLIDPVAPDNPVVLSRADGHSILVNSYVLKNSGITKDTPDPYGGEIQRYPGTTEPTGILKEKARLMIKTGAVEVKRTPEEEEARRLASWKAALDLAARLGVTTVQIPTTSRQLDGTIDPSMYVKFRDMNELTLRVYFSGVMTADEQALQEYKELWKQYPLEDNWIRFGWLKGFIDGTLGSATMLVFEPFEDEPEKTGLPQMPYEELEKRVIASDKWGFQVAIHAIGDKANNWILNAFEKAQQVNGIRDSRHRSEHAQFIRENDIGRFAELGVIPSMQPTHCITDKRFAEKRVGLERCRTSYAWRSLLESGARIAFGTDYSVEPLNPMEGLYASVTRKDRLGETGPGWFPEQILSMEEAIELYTLGAAYAEFMEGRKGMIKSGYLADIVIMNDDILTVPHDQIMKTPVDYTIVGGKVIYKREGAN